MHMHVCTGKHKRSPINTYAHAHTPALSHICTYIHIGTYRHTHAYMHMHTHWHRDTHTCTHTHTYTSKCVSGRTQTYAHKYIDTRTHVHIHAYWHARTHAYTQFSSTSLVLGEGCHCWPSRWQKFMRVSYVWIMLTALLDPKPCVVALQPLISWTEENNINP